MSTMATATHLHRVNSTSSRRVILVRQTSVKLKPTISIEQNSQQLTDISTSNKPHRSLFNMRRRQGNDPNSPNDQRICTKENCLTCCKKFTAFMFSRVGLFLVMIGYVALGGLVFQALESGNEYNMRAIMGEKLDSTLLKLWDAMLTVNSLPEKDKKANFSSLAMQQLEIFERIVIQQVQQGFDGRTSDSEQDWNFFGAVLYAVTLVSTIGYGHITTKTTQGKIATILYSAFGVPLMMLFVANIGSTMAKMFAFVFTRVTMVVCCRMGNKKKRALALKNRQKLYEKNNQSDGKLPPIAAISNEQKKDIVLPIKDGNLATDVNLRNLPANVRLNMLTGISNSNPSHSLTSSRTSLGEKSKDAIVRMNDLIRQNSVQDIEEINHDEPIRRQSMDVKAIQYYINETNKLTSNLDAPTQSIEKDEKPITNQEENNMKQVVPLEDSTNNDNGKETKKSSKKNLKRSKSESIHNRRSQKKPVNENTNANETKPPRRRFFSRKNKVKKEASVVDEEKSANDTSLRKTQSFNEHSPRSLPPPPDYEQSTTNDITPLPTTVTWKGEHKFYPNTTIDLTNHHFGDDEDFDDDDEESVPLLVTVFVIPLYLTLGAVLFSIWEQWSFLDSFYFCFITLTTIGFGDFVPGIALQAKAEKEKLISAAVYILFGLVLIAMCVNLMKEQLSQRVKRVANKLGSF